MATPDSRESPERHIVWICAGCDRCQPLDGSERQGYPCTDTSPSMDGAEVVRADDYDRVRAHAVAAWRQLIYRGSGINDVPAELRDDVSAALDRDAVEIRAREAARREANHA